jgi:hypothetical protein
MHALTRFATAIVMSVGLTACATGQESSVAPVGEGEIATTPSLATPERATLDLGGAPLVVSAPRGSCRS